MRKSLLLVILALTAVVAAACGGGDHADHMALGGGDHAEGAIPGSAAAASEATREVTVEATDQLEFDPGSIEVEAGEVVTFVVKNTGTARHEFVLGDEHYQETHASDMKHDGHDMGDMSNAVVVEAGETAELTWRFEESGEVLFGCHEPGHYDGGMFGRITVTA